LIHDPTAEDNALRGKDQADIQQTEGKIVGFELPCGMILR